MNAAHSVVSTNDVILSSCQDMGVRASYVNVRLGYGIARPKEEEVGSPELGGASFVQGLARRSFRTKKKLRTTKDKGDTEEEIIKQAHTLNTTKEELIKMEEDREQPMKRSNDKLYREVK
uniref:Uncharacterized protein n=1 Tax=Cucumis melo TaxID=3656 RepID=A0A9I9E8G7_CUCME